MPDKKRKRKQDPAAGAGADTDADPMDVFRQHFESRFAPLKRPSHRQQQPRKGGERVPEKQRAEIPDRSTQQAEKNEVVEVDATNGLSRLAPKPPRSEIKSFMTSKPPLPQPPPPPPPQSKKSGQAEDDPKSEAELLKNDLALQRLLRESHLLDASSGSLEATGKQRLKAVDLRIRTLGGKELAQRMPMARRKSMTATQEKREEKRRKEAKEAGIILEKETKSKKKKAERRRGVGLGGRVGRFKGGALVLSKKDVMDIEGRRGNATKRT